MMILNTNFPKSPPDNYKEKASSSYIVNFVAPSFAS